MDGPVIFEQGDKIYMVGPVAPIQPSDSEVAEYAFADSLRAGAPNEKLLWLRGQYVEADRANRNGQFWSSDDIAIKSLQPKLMPVTVMHDPSTAVGLIADTQLLTPDADKVPRARIDTALAVWAHRFPEVAEEIAANYGQGTLMQSMEADAPCYDCVDCGRVFVKMPQGAERANWCEHLREAAAANRPPVRRLLDVTFTGTGLIFGTRSGAVGALDTAHLESFQSEVAEFHERAHSPNRRIPRRSSVDEITIKRDEYDKLQADARKGVELAQRVTTLEAELAEAKTAGTKVDQLEIDLQAAKTEAAAEKAAKEALEETARAATLSDTRVAALGDKFLAALPDTVKGRLTEQAKTLSDDDWTARLDELAEMAKVKPDEKTDAAAGGSASTTTAAGVVTDTETARSQFGTGGNAGGQPSAAARTTVMTGLFRSTRKAQPPKTNEAGK